ILADYSMPQFSAIDALQIVRRRGLDIPFIIVSGTIGEDTAVAAMKAGAHDYIMKGNAARLVPAIDRELREAAERASRRKAERRFKALIEHASDITTVVDQLGTVVYQSPSIERILGWRPEDVIGTKFTSRVYSEDVEAVQAAIERPPGKGIHYVEYRFREPDDKWCTLEATV